VAQPEPAKQDEDKTPPEGLSQFLGKVLDQLSLSAWLPAVMLVGCGAVLTQFRTQGSFDIGKAVIELTNKPIGIIIVLLFAVVMATLISQAFSFMAIRLLEGYWRGPLVGTGIYRLLVRMKARKRRRLDRKMDHYTKIAFNESIQTMHKKGISKQVTRIIEDRDYPDNSTPALTPDQLDQVSHYDWRNFCHPDRLGHISQTEQAIKDHPPPHLVMPTKLGNILRVTEIEITPHGQDVEGLMLRTGDSVPSRLRLHHDQFRTRLDMYCTLVFTNIMLVALTLIMLPPRPNSLIGTAILATIFLMLSAVSYMAAVASARGYCATLRAIHKK